MCCEWELWGHMPWTNGIEEFGAFNLDQFIEIWMFNKKRKKFSSKNSWFLWFSWFNHFDMKKNFFFIFKTICCSLQRQRATICPSPNSCLPTNCRTASFISDKLYTILFNVGVSLTICQRLWKSWLIISLLRSNFDNLSEVHQEDPNKLYLVLMQMGKLF